MKPSCKVGAVVRILLTVVLDVFCSFPALADEESKPATEEKTVSPPDRIVQLDELVRTLGQQTTTLDVELKQLQLQSADLKLRLKNATGQRDELTRARAGHLREIEKLLKESGEWISFSQQIAPILQNQCAACHNARNAKGQYSVDHFAAMLRKGESGEIPVVPSKAEDSYLFQLIRDGSMPQDAEPLPTAQIELIRKWIELGARLDADISPDAELFRIMPQPVHPAPPDCYPAAMPVAAVALSPDGNLIASSGYHEVLLWSLSDRQLVRRIPGVAQRVQALAFHPDGKRLAVASGTPGRFGEVKLFDVTSGEFIAGLLVSQDFVPAIAISPDGQRLAVGETTGAVSVFLLDGELKQVWQANDHSDWVNSIAWSSDGRQLVSASRDKTCKIFDASTGALGLTFAEHGQNVVAALFAGDRVVSAASDGKVKIWQVGGGKKLHDLSNLCGEISSVIPFNQGRVLVIGLEKTAVEVNPQDGAIIRKISLPTEWNLCAAFMGSSDSLIFGSHDGNLTILSLQDPSLAPRTWPAIPEPCN